MQDDYLSDAEFDKEIEELERDLFTKPEEYSSDFKIRAAYDDGYYKGYYDGLEKSSEKHTAQYKVESTNSTDYLKKYQENRRLNSLVFIIAFFLFVSFFLFGIVRDSGIEITFDIISKNLVFPLFGGIFGTIFLVSAIENGWFPINSKNNIIPSFIFALVGFALVLFILFLI